MILLWEGSDFYVDKIVVNLKLIDLDLNRKIVTKFQCSLKTNLHLLPVTVNSQGVVYGFILV